MTEIEKLLKTEGKNVEFKLERPQKDVTFLKTVVAFANCQGGRFVFGIRNEDHAIIGMDDETLFQDMDTITNIISDNCEPAIIPNVYPMTLNDKSLIVVEINIGRQRPYYVKALGMMEGTYIRVAAETRKAEEYMIKELMFEGAHRFFDKTVCLGLEASDDEINALCHSLQETASRYHKTGRRSKSIREVTPNQLLSWGVLTRKENQIVPTNAFALLTGHYLLPTMTQCAVFKGTMKGNFIDKREYEGPIQQQQEEAYQFVLRNIKLGARIKGLYRQDVYEIPPDAIREILVDAVVHRSYLATGNIQVALYDDRLEVMTPGKLPIDQTIETMKNGFSKIRNEAIAKAFAYMGLIEAWGSGIPKINFLLKEAGLQEMEISGGDFWVKFTIYRNLKFDPMAANNNVGVESKNVGVESKNVGVESKNVGVESKNVGVESKSVGVEPKDVGVESKSVGVESKSVGVEPKDVGVESKDVGVEPKDVGVEPKDVGVEPKDVGVESKDVGVESKDVGVESKDVGVESKDVGVEPKDVGVEPKDVGVESKDVGVEPKDVGVESKDVGVESKDVGVENEHVVWTIDKIGILQMIQENPHITAKELATKLHTTTRTAERIFRQLKQSGKIRREGSDRYGHWIVLKLQL